MRGHVWGPRTAVSGRQARLHDGQVDRASNGTRKPRGEGLVRAEMGV